MGKPGAEPAMRFVALMGNPHKHALQGVFGRRIKNNARAEGWGISVWGSNDLGWVKGIL
jgi:hypothetical protein